MRILMLGNSLTSANSMPDTLSLLSGYETFALTRGGARLSEFGNPATKNGARVRELLENQSWDYVVLQEMSHQPATNTARYLENARKVCQLAREADATPVIFGTWAYREDCPRLQKLGMDYGTMAARMIEAAQQAADDNDALLAPVGSAFYLAEDPALYAKDGVHPSVKGSWTAAYLIAHVLGVAPADPAEMLQRMLKSALG